MENSVGANDVDVAAAAEVVSAEKPATAAGPSKSDENDAPPPPDQTKGPPAVDGQPVAERDDVVPAAVAGADDKDRPSRSAPGDVDDLNDAMASTSISTAPPDNVEQSQGGDVTNEPQKQVAAVEKENVASANANVDSDVSVKPPPEHGREANSTVAGFENAREYNDDEEYCVERDQNNVTRQDHVSAPESCGEEELDDEEAAEEGEEGAEPVASAPAVPVPVDDDTNDPQYIPRRGRFYEHDDRMAYSTTSSEGSDSDIGYEYDSGDEDCEGSDRRIRRRRTSSKRGKSTISGDLSENNIAAVADSTVSSKKVLAISKVAAAIKDSSETSANSAGGSAKKPGSRKSRDIDSLDRWTHDLYDEREQTRKSRDELLASYGYDIREESEAPRARRHHKYGRAATAKYTRNWQDTKAYTGAGGAQQSSKAKRGGLGRRSVGGPNKNKNKSATSDEYTSEFPALDKAKPSESTTSEVPVVAEPSGQQPNQQAKSSAVQNQEKNNVPASTATAPSRHNAPPSRPFTKQGPSYGNRNHHQDSQNGGQTSFSSSHNKNFFNRSSTDSPIGKEKVTQVNRENTSGTANMYNRKPHQHNSGHNPHQNFKQQSFNNTQSGQAHNQHHPHSSSASHRGRNFHQHHNSPQQYNRDRYFAKGSLPPSSNSNQHHYDQPHHNNVTHTTAGTGRTQHSGGNYHHFSNRQYENENEAIEQPPAQPPPPVVRSSKRYSVQSRRELPDPVLNFGGMSKTPQPQQQTPVTQHQQQNGLVMQEQQQTSLQQMQPTPQQLQQQQPIQIHQQQPPPMQIQQYHQPLQQIHPHHGMVLDHNTGMMVMATADPSMYHHQLYAPPQYATTVPPGSSTGGTDDQAVAAAAALQMLAAQAAVYQPVPTGATGLTSPPSGTQSLQQQQSETFMTTYYQPQQQTQQQPPPRRVNLAIPIVAPPPEPNQQQGPPKTNSSPTPPPAATAAGASSN